MSQQEIVDFLKNNRTKFSAAQIIYHLNGQLSASVVYANLKKLIRTYEVNTGWYEFPNSKQHPVRLYWYKNASRK